MASSFQLGDDGGPPAAPSAPRPPAESFTKLFGPPAPSGRPRAVPARAGVLGGPAPGGQPRSRRPLPVDPLTGAVLGGRAEAAGPGAAGGPGRRPPGGPHTQLW
jgi:hypothetical protein